MVEAMNENLKQFRATIEAAQKRVGPNKMVTTIFQSPTMYDQRGREVKALELFERRVRRLYERKTGKPLTKWVPIGVIVLFVVMHWSQIMAILKAILFVLRLRKPKN